MKKLVVGLLLSSVLSCKTQEPGLPQNTQNYYSFDQNRIAAEWEPARGVMFACPPVIPRNLIIELARDTHLYPLVDSDSEQARALKWFLAWGIDTSRVTFVRLPKVDADVIVPRDWGPPAVFTPEGSLKLADAQYKNSDPFTDRPCNDSLQLHKVKGTNLDYYSTNADTLIAPLARQLGLEVLEVPFASTGGNVLTDGVGTAFSTCILLSENRFNGLSDSAFFALNQGVLGLRNYHLISNFEEYGIQHIDCLLKLVDEETLLVAQPPVDHALYPVYEDIVQQELIPLRNAYGRPYTIKRIPLSRIIDEHLTAYTNALILNKTVYVPLYSVATDSLALQRWQEVLPGYTVKGFEYVLQEEPYLDQNKFAAYLEYGPVPGWAPDDALHCRTRAIWEEDMIFISLNKIPARLAPGQNAVVHASIRDYLSGKQASLAVKLYWRYKGADRWQEENMRPVNNPYHYTATLPTPNIGVEVQYYIAVVGKEGRMSQRPLTAPKGFYTFTYGQE